MIHRHSRGARTGAAIVLAAFALAVFALTGCDSASEAPQGLVPALRGRQEAAGRAHPYENLGELLGNTLYRVGDRPPTAMTTAVVTGRFTDLEPGRAFAVPGRDAAGGTVVDDDSPDVLWRTMHAAFEVDEVVSGQHPGPTTVIGLSFDAGTELAPVEEDLTGLGRVVLFLERSSVFGYDPRVHGVVLDGGLIATVDATGRLALPVLEDGEAARLLEGTGTLSSLRARAAEPPRVIALDPTGTERLEADGSSDSPEDP